MGGGELARSLFAAGVIDEVGLNVHPVLLGSGAPLFRDAGRRITLELAESRVIDGGCVLSTYRVVAAREPGMAARKRTKRTASTPSR
jgi:dihydrofolate reductase